MIYTISLLPTPLLPASDSALPSSEAPQPESSLPPSPSKTEPIIGLLGLSRWNTLTYFIHPTHWNHGYCTEAIQSFLPLIWEREPRRRHVSASIMEGNAASRRVLEKVGFVEWDWGRGVVRVKAKGSEEKEDDRGEREVEAEEREVEEREREEAEVVEEDEGSGVDEMPLGGGIRRLSKIQTDELTAAIESMKVQTRPTIEPIRAPPVENEGGTSRPMKKTSLIGYRYERK
jgi:hypothetical protein